MSRPTRQLTLVDCFGLGINGIVGSGIFLLPAALQRRAGSQSPLAWLVVGALCTLIALCFAEAASRTDRSGGPYRYAVEAFGPLVGFAVGWITMISSLLGYAAVARGFAEHAAYLVGGGDSVVALALCVVAVVVFLAIVNVIGVKLSARTGDVISVIKVLGLLAFVGVGLFFVKSGNLHAAPAPAKGETPGLFAAAFAGLFACTGFEYVPVPAGETINPQRTIGLAMVVSVVGATLLYMVVQTVAMGVLPTIGSSERPIVDAARAFAGNGGATAIAVVATLSALGFCVGSAIVVPRYIETFAQDAFLPRILARRSARFDTPVIAIIATSVLTIALGATLDFDKLADVSNVAIVAQYISTCIAIMIWRHRDPTPAGFRLPFGPVIPLLAIAGSVLFLFHVSRVELLFGAALLVAGLAFGAATRFFRRPRAASA
ncbi:MAG TPA: APC family permease [Polyangia bacterium]|nr:APC family permease [Polyangia bacterium]